MKLTRLGLLLPFFLLVGCARLSTTTTLRADGSFTRKIVYTASKSNGMGPADPNTPNKEKPEDYFKIPSAGPGLQVARSEDKNGLMVTTTREVTAGTSPVQDITLWADKGKVLATSSVSVTKLANGQIEYVETLHALESKAATGDKFMIPDLRARVKKAIPAEYQKTETIDKITMGISVNLVHALVGPPEPNLFNMLGSQDVTIRRINAIAFKANIKTFKEIIPGLDDGMAISMARSLANILNPEAMDQSNAAADASKPKENSNGNEMTPMFFVVSFPGKVVETDGIIDPVTGEVYWSLLPMALDLGDVKLRLVVQP